MNIELDPLVTKDRASMVIAAMQCAAMLQGQFASIFWTTDKPVFLHIAQARDNLKSLNKLLDKLAG
jgi:hypothetical protein